MSFNLTVHEPSKRHQKQNKQNEKQQTSETRRERCRASSVVATIPRRRSPRPPIDRFPLHRNVVVACTPGPVVIVVARARSKSHHPHAPQKKKRLVRERGALSTASNARAESAFANMRSAWGIRLTVHNSRKWVWTFACKAQSREIDRSRFAPSLCPRPLDARSIDGISTLIECGRDLIDGNARSRELIGGFCGSGLDSDRWFDGVANRSRRLTHDE